MDLARHAQQAETLAESQSGEAQQPRQEAPGEDRHGRERESRDGPSGLDERDGKAWLQIQPIPGSETIEEQKRVAVAPQEQVLPIVHRAARLRIHPRPGAAAQIRARLEEEDPGAPLGEQRGGGQSREAAADHDRIGGPYGPGLHRWIPARAPATRLRPAPGRAAPSRAA